MGICTYCRCCRSSPLQLEAGLHMAAQRALECRDILAEIFETLSAIYDEDIFTGAEGPWRSDLASAACVCRAFSEPALAVLWRSLDDVEPVFRVLPSFIRQESGLAYEWVSYCLPFPGEILSNFKFVFRFRAAHHRRGDT